MRIAASGNIFVSSSSSIFIFDAYLFNSKFFSYIRVFIFFKLFKTMSSTFFVGDSGGTIWNIKNSSFPKKNLGTEAVPYYVGCPFLGTDSSAGIDSAGKFSPWPQRYSAGILKQSMGARNRVRIGLPYRPARQHAWRNWFLVIDSWAPQKFKNSGSGTSPMEHRKIRLIKDNAKCRHLQP